MRDVTILTNEDILDEMQDIMETVGDWSILDQKHGQHDPLQDRYETLYDEAKTRGILE